MFRIEGGGDDEGNVAINLPLRAVGAVMAMAPDDILTSDGRLVVAEAHGVSVSDIRQAWQGIKDAGDAEFVTLQKAERTVRVARAGDQIEVRIEGDDETVRVDLPLALVDVLLSGDGETLNIAAALDPAEYAPWRHRPGDGRRTSDPRLGRRPVGAVT